jgi:hypothetical protein
MQPTENNQHTDSKGKLEHAYILLASIPMDERSEKLHLVLGLIKELLYECGGEIEIAGLVASRWRQHSIEERAAKHS